MIHKASGSRRSVAAQLSLEAMWWRGEPNTGGYGYGRHRLLSRSARGELIVP